MLIYEYDDSDHQSVTDKFYRGPVPYVRNDPVNKVDPDGHNAASFMCSAEYRYAECGGDDLFWSGSFQFGDVYGGALAAGYTPGMPADMWAGLQQYNAQVQAAFAAAAAAAAQNNTPEPGCVQKAIMAAAIGVGLNLSSFDTISVQIIGTTGPDGVVYDKTELNLSGGDVNGLIKQMQDLGFYSNNPNDPNYDPFVGAPHTISVGQNAGLLFTGNFRAPGLTGSLQVNTRADTGDVQMDVDQFNPASGLLGLIFHGLLQYLPNKISGTDNTYGCNH